jgi:hypothetical protein
MITKLFKTDELVYICGPLKPEGGYSNPRVLTAQQIDEQPELLTLANQFCVNPLQSVNNNPNPEGSRRHGSNVIRYRNFLLESDTLPLEIQYDLIPALAEVIPIRTIVYSGSKSLHYLISVSDDLNCNNNPELYKQYWKGLEQLATETVKKLLPSAPSAIFDQSTKDVVRLARLPNGIRNFTDDRPSTLQKVVYEGSLITAEELAILAAKVPLTIYKSTMKVASVSNVKEFERELKVRTSLQWLKSKLENPEDWAKSEGMYHEMFKLALWCADLTNVNYPTLEAYLQQKIYPTIKSTGYTRDVTAGAFNAYKWKGLV